MKRKNNLDFQEKLNEEIKSIDLTPSPENIKSCEIFYKLGVMPTSEEVLDPTPLAIPLGYERPKTKAEILRSFGYATNSNLYEDDTDEDDAIFDPVRDEFFQWASEFELDAEGRSQVERIMEADELNRQEMERAMEFYKARKEQEMNNPRPPEADERVVKADVSSEAGLAQPPSKVDGNES